MLKTVIVGSVATCAVFFASASSAFAGGVAILDAPGLGVMPDIQTAIDAAAPGDVLLIGPGTYPAFTIDNKTLYLFALPGDAVDVAGTITIRNLGPAKRVVLSGIGATGSQVVGASAPGLVLANNAGHVRFQSCSFTGGEGLSASCNSNGVGGPAISAIASARVAFTRCMIVGGAGHSGVFPADLDCRGGDGGDAVFAQGSALALFESTLIGGAGGANGSIGGNGGAGLRQVDFGSVISGCTLRGGAGGTAWDTFPQHGGNGGNGMITGAGAQEQLFDNTFAGGAPGQAPVGGPQLDGIAGVPMAGSGLVHAYNVASRHFAAPAIAADQSALVVTVHGEPKDIAYVAESNTPAWQLTPRFLGVWFVPYIALHTASSAQLDDQGEGTVVRTMQSITSAPHGRIAWLQGIAIQQGVRALQTPLQVLVIDRAAQPDCDGNGTCDWLDLVEGTTGDCDGDLATDACEVVAGAPDCNGNAIPDACDIASGSSPDLNHNGVPDECDPLHQTLWVDAAAAPGGDGSAQAPYQNLKNAFDGALSGDAIVVRDGLYTGPMNVGLQAFGRTLSVASEHGAANCIVDTGFNTQSLCMVVSGEVRFDGFTMRNGRRFIYVWDVDLNDAATPRAELVDCTIENCIETPVWNSFGELRTERCTFRGSTVAGAAAIANTGAAEILGCSFENNHSNLGAGAISCSVRAPVRIEGCRFTGNSAAGNGGAVLAGIVEAQGSFEIVDCRFEQNSAAQGGALCLIASNDVPSGRMRVRNSIFTSNSATVRGGSIRVADRTRCDLWNSILWFGSAPAGAELSVGNGAAIPSELQVAFCDVQGGLASVHNNSGTLGWAASNFALDPMFSDAARHLALNSPCLDAGNNGLVALDALDLDHDGIVVEPVPFDFDGHARFVDVPSAPDVGVGSPPLVDLGCYEHP